MSTTKPMPFDVVNYFADTTHFSTAQHGAYLLILFSMWRAGGPIPGDDRTLARIAGLPVPIWLKISPPVLDQFVFDGTFLTHPRTKFPPQPATKAHTNPSGGWLQ